MVELPFNGKQHGVVWLQHPACQKTTPSETKPATVYLFGPLIDAPPAHQDTALTSRLYMNKSLLDLDMQYANMCVDMQLYMVAQQIKWWDQHKFRDVVLRPGAMHIIMSFLGCIGTLMKSSGLDVLIGAAFGGMNGIITGKAWLRATRAFRMVLAALLQNFLRTGAKTCEEITAYMEEARKHPTGRHWVDNFLKPTILIGTPVHSCRERATGSSSSYD